MRNNKKLICIFILSIGLLTACNFQKYIEETSSPQMETTTINQMETSIGESRSEVLKAEFGALIEKEDLSFKELMLFIKENISEVDKESATRMVMVLEDFHIKDLTSWSEQFNTEEMQESLFEDSKNFTLDLNNPDNLTKDIVKDLVISTKELGYRIEMAEASFFPVIDYSFYEQFMSYVNDDLNSYILLMVAESSEPSMKDAAIVISYDEIVKRALLQESFLKNYPESELSNKVSNLYNKYVYLTYYGAPNTPLFNFSSKIILEEAKLAYEAALEIESESEYLLSLAAFMNILYDYNFKLEDEADAYRNEIIDTGTFDESKAVEKLHIFF